MLALLPTSWYQSPLSDPQSSRNSLKDSNRQPNGPELFSLHSLEAHLIVVPEVADPYMLIHVGVVKVLTQPADVTPIEIPFTFTAVRETRVRPENPGAAGVSQHTSI